MLTFVAAIGVLLADSPAAQTASDTDCPSPRTCPSDRQRALLAAYEVRTLEAHQADGDQVRRVFYVDGYGRDLILIAFVRSPGRDPMLSLHFPGQNGRRPMAIQTPVPGEIWDEVMRRSYHFDRELIPASEPTSAEQPICSHSWQYIVEGTGSTRERGTESIRRKIVDTCDDGLAQDFAEDAARLARPLLPSCAALDLGQYQNSPILALSACRLLGGDRIAAAAALNRADSFRQVRSERQAGLLAGRFHYSALIDWNGSRSANGEAAPQFWIEQISRAGDVSLFFDSVHGESADRVRITGRLSRWVRAAEDVQPRPEMAPVEFTWESEAGGLFQVRRVTVGPWQAWQP